MSSGGWKRFGAAVMSLWSREIKRFLRQRSRLVGALAQPLFFWLLLGIGFSGSFRLPAPGSGPGYMEFLFPGMLVLTLLFTAIFATISVIEDRREGFLQSVLVAPVPRISIACGSILGASTLAVGQAALFLLLAPAIGIHLTFASTFLTLGLLAVISLSLSSLGFIIAWRMDSTQGFHAVMNMVLIPLWLLSGAFFPVDGAPGWFGAIMRLNPLTYGTMALRHGLYLHHPVPVHETVPFVASLGITVLFAACMLVAASLGMRLKKRPIRKQR